MKNEMKNEISSALDLMTYKDVAEYLKVTPLTILNWVKKGYIPKPTQFSPHRFVWDKNKLLKWIEEKFDNNY